MVAITLILLCYYCLLVVLLIGWSRALRQVVPAQDAGEQMITVVIAIRNEEKHMHRLLSDLAAQQYGNFEVVIVNDHSSDASAGLLRASALANLTVLQNAGAGKKSAIATGVSSARGSVIVTTDADCSLPPQWLKTISEHFKHNKVKLAFGGVCIRPDGSFFSHMQAIEFASLIGSGAATAALSMPTMCNGANLAYRKSVFDEVNGYEGNLHIASGDDEFLMRKVHDRYPQGVRFIASGDAVVRTRPQPKISSFLHQRMRWASKWRYNSSAGTVALAVFILASQIASLWCLLSLVISFSYTALFLLAGKALLESVFLLRACRFLKIPWHWPAFFALQLIHPVYVIFVGIASNFIAVYWKERKISRQ
jgi:poly-beta-1,6-N-acetyl-D-glucosamine synthase